MVFAWKASLFGIWTLLVWVVSGVFSELAHAVAIVDYGAAATTATGELGSAVVSALPLFGTIVAIGVGMRIVKKFWLGGVGSDYYDAVDAQPGGYDASGDYQNDGFYDDIVDYEDDLDEYHGNQEQLAKGSDVYGTYYLDEEDDEPDMEHRNRVLA